MEQTNYEKALIILKHLDIDHSSLPSKLITDDRFIERTNKDIILDNYNEESLHYHYKEFDTKIRTVRFLKDFDLLNAGIDLKTKNTSFKRVAEIFRTMGIKNYYFMLQLNNPTLIGVDARDPDLPDFYKPLIIKECCENIWYFLREVCVLSDGRNFEANRAVISFIWNYLNHNTTILILPRQQGKTVGCQVILFWLTYIVGRKYYSNLLTLQEKNRIQFVEAIKSIRLNCPSWLTNITYKDKETGSSITYEAWGVDNKNSITIDVTQMSKEGAMNVGRGATYKTLARDEPAYIKYIEEIINASGASANTAQDNARQLGEPYGTFYITTPNSTLNPSGSYMYDMLMESTEWREIYFDSFSESHLKARLIKASPKETTIPYVGMVYNYLQLGKGKEWIKETQDKLHMSDASVKIDLLLYWEEDNKDLLFEPKVREALNLAKKDIIWSQEIGKTNLFIDWFITREEHENIMFNKSNTFYLIGCDTSGAVGKDACTVIIRDIITGDVVGVGRYALAFLMDVGEVLKTLLFEIKNSLLIIERNYASHMIDQLLLSLPAIGVDPFTRIYNQIFQDKIKYNKEFDEVKARSFSARDDNFYLKFKDKFGFNTTQQTRNELYGFLEEAVGMTGSGIKYYKLIDELNSLKIKNGRIDHSYNGHDDLVIAWLLSFWYIKLGNNKSEYNIPPGLALSGVRTLKFEEAIENISAYELAKIELYKSKIEELTNELLSTDDVIYASRLEHEIKKFSEHVPVEVKRSLTIDEIIEEAKEERRVRSLELRRQSIYNNQYKNGYRR